MAAPVRQASTGPYFCSTNTKAAAHRNAVVTSNAKAAAAASDVSRSAVPVELLEIIDQSLKHGNASIRKAVN